MDTGMGQEESNFRYLLALLTDIETGRLEGLHPCIAQYPMAMKAKKYADPDGPTYHESQHRQDKDLFNEAMVNEIEDLEAHKTWDIIPKSSVPTGKRVLPSTWVLQIKH